MDVEFLLLSFKHKIEINLLAIHLAVENIIIVKGLLSYAKLV